MGKRPRDNRTEAQATLDEAPNEESAFTDYKTPKFAKLLASSDKDEREKAMKALELFLRRAHDIDDLEMRKTWKALFYCFWHSDKPKVQRDLAERLAALMHSIAPGKEWAYVRGFWQTIMREWAHIDRLRLNKFYLLKRCFLDQSFRRVAKEEWAQEEVEALATVLALPLATSSPPGIRYFLADNLLGAVRHAHKHSPAGTALNAEGLLLLLEPFVQLMARSEDDAMLRRVTEGVLDPLLRSEEETEGEEEEEEEVELPVPLEELAERLFDAASAKGTRERNRKPLYGLQQRVETAA
eukprot:CAMPEP_0174726590 /NCGR_PEP_ID=MMETSP1094-20130205/48089_1 /TAXON_ID=156173 /ORGANISM="Chrysochromulina brevifilum, Strain UTEX LB 985" /LENGTH=296 /DNA_ID=CAMNT_0015928189 /DNA_START=16 /DNA_END=903 /DNA_ORIENTATION=+